MVTISRHYPVPGGSVPQHISGQEAGVTVRMNFYSPQAKQVSVAGDFNKWRTDALPMSRQDGGVWTIDLTLKPGVYTYMFVVDGKAWVTDPDAETYQDDGFGNKNAVMRIRT
jgi:1,4-alpha-glucan branching enzyme